MSNENIQYTHTYFIWCIFFLSFECLTLNRILRTKRRKADFKFYNSHIKVDWKCLLDARLDIVLVFNIAIVGGIDESLNWKNV